MDPEQIKALQAALTSATTALTATTPVEAGAKAETTTESPAQELARLRQEKADAAVAAGVKTAADQAVAQIMEQQRNDQSRIADMINAEITRALGGDVVTESGVKGIVASSLNGLTMGRKTPLTLPAGETARGGVYIPANHMGEKGNFASFALALGRKDISAVADMQRDNGIQNGYGAHLGFGVKAMTEGAGAGSAVSGPSGGYLVPPEYATDLIPFLYPYVVIRRAGAKTRTMKSNAFYRPRLAGGATASYIGETAPIPSSQQSFDQFSLVAKELAGFVPVSKLLVNDSDPEVEAILKQDLSEQIGLKEDFTFMYGAGSATVPQGILSRNDIQIMPVVGTNGDNASYGLVSDMLDKLDEANVPERRRVWIGNTRVKNSLRKVLDANGRPIFTEFMNVQDTTLVAGDGTPNVAQPRATLMGLPFYTSTQIPVGTTGTNATADLALVEMSEVVIGQMGAMELEASTDGVYVDGGGATISAFQSNLVLYRAIMRHDINLEHTSCVVLKKGIIC